MQVRRGLGAGALALACTGAVWGAGVRSAQAQDDQSIEQLRKEAEQAAEGDQGGAKNQTAAQQLLHEADLQSAQNDTLYQELLNAFSSVANRLNGFNPRLTAIGDILGRYAAGSHKLVDRANNVNIDNRISLREMELHFLADIDPYAKGVFVFSVGEDAPNTYSASVEEGYVTLETLPFGFAAQVGRFRVPFGRINKLHTHDLPSSYYPYALQDLFGDEGYKDDGAILDWLAPWFPLQLHVGILNGENRGVFGSGAAALTNNSPAWLGRAEYFMQFTNSTYLSVGGTYLYGYNRSVVTPNHSRPHQESQVWGADLLFKWQPSQYRSLVASCELYGLRKHVATGYDHMFGAYASLLYQPYQRWYAGVRYDFSNYDQGVEGHKQWAASAWISFYTSEFLRFRVGVEHRERQSTGPGGHPNLDTIFFQLTFVFGSHPAEPFWVNR